jgi:energy-coupling factor transporter ATP-binding protein EcfA2
MAASVFQRAVKYASKGRVALVGPAGSGKSYTMLILAQLLAGEGGKIAAIDTEQGSLSKYADEFDFDVMPLSSYTVDDFLGPLHAAEKAGYSVFCCDSLSHFWMGKNGALEFVDAAKRSSSSRDDMSGWKAFRPHERAMVDAMIASPLHIICTMRTKTDYAEQVVDGKKKRVKIGLAPVQRDGLEYEFDLVCAMDDDNTLVVDKTRCSALAGKALIKPTGVDLAVFRDWLQGAARPTGPQAVAAQPPATPQAEPQRANVFSLTGNRLTCTVTGVAQKETAKGKKYVNIAFAGEIEGKYVASCWDTALFESLLASRGKVCQFEIEIRNGFVSIETLLAVGGQEYRGGKPYTEGQTTKTETGGLFRDTEITDDDIPF